MLSFFDMLGLRADFALNEETLEQAYFEAQKQYHPDRLVGASETQRITAVERSQFINEAYDTLKNPLTRAEHMLRLRGIEVNTEENNAVSPPLLMEVMELRERIHSKMGDGHGLLEMVEEVKAIANQCAGDLAAAFAAEDMATAVNETMRLSYLTKALEEAYTMLYRFKSQKRHAHD